MKEVNLIGGFYLSKSRSWTAQDVVNWIPVKSVAGGTRSPLKLRGAPGLRSLLTITPPPAPGIFTSTPYPVVVIEAMDSTGSTNSGLTLGGYIEAADSFGSLDSGELRSILQTYAMLPEAVDSIGAINDGVLRQILIDYAMLPEAVDSTGTLGNGELRAILITYTNWPAEAIDSTGTLTGGTLA